MKGIFRLLILVAACSVLSSPAFGDDKPESTEEAVQQARKGERAERLDDFDFAVKIPKPEALVFEKRRKARYEPQSHKKSFTNAIVRSARSRALDCSIEGDSSGR